VSVVGLAWNVAALSAGYQHTCALLSSGMVDCWGDNASGQLGTSTTTSASTAQSVSGISGVVAVSAGYLHTCAVTSDGAVWCWGDNTYGELGTGSGLSSETPVLVSGLTGAVAVAAGANFTCALTSGGDVSCWGAGALGEMGNGLTSISNPAPVPVSTGLSGVVAISAPAGGTHVCALTAAGAVYCWGYNAHGELGDGTTTNRSSPVKAKLLSGAVATAIGTGDEHSCAAVTGVPSGYYCWGNGADYQLGNGSTTSPETKPVAAGF
jgi:alpha-tubulin suppressor-like RCC1 family protein